jgi:O-antigen/teichoic acid export membrane protein
MIILNLSIFFNAMLAAANSVFIGFERMGLLSICSICAAIAQSGLTVLLVYFGYGAMGAAVGYTFSSIVVGILAVALLYFAIFRKLSRDETSKFTTYQTLKPMFKYGLPLALSAVLVGVASQFSWFVLSSNVDLSSIGNLRVTQNFMVLLTFVAFPISTSLFPAFSKLDPKNEKPLIASVFAASVKYAVLFLIPATMVMMVLAKPIIGTIYGDKWALAPTFLTLGIINYLFTIFGSLSISSFLSAMEETKLILKLNVLTLLLIIPLCLLVIPAFGVIGAIFAGYAANSPNWIIGLYASRKKYGVKPNLGSSGRIFLSSAIAACFCYLSLNILSLDSWMQLIVGLAVFLLTYLLTLPVVQGITFSGSGPVLKLLEVPLYLEEQILKRLVRIKKVDLLEETSAEQAM